MKRKIRHRQEPKVFANPLCLGVKARFSADRFDREVGAERRTVGKRHKEVYNIGVQIPNVGQRFPIYVGTAVTADNCRTTRVNHGDGVELFGGIYDDAIGRAFNRRGADAADRKSRANGHGDKGLGFCRKASFAKSDKTVKQSPVKHCEPYINRAVICVNKGIGNFEIRFVMKIIYLATKAAQSIKDSR